MNYKDSLNWEAHMNKLVSHNAVRQFTLTLCENSAIPWNEVQNVLDEVSDSISEAHNTYIKKEIDRILREKFDNETHGKIYTSLDEYKDPFKDFPSECMKLLRQLLVPKAKRNLIAMHSRV